ncbi:MAG TPA: amidohydrolase family protein [Polyangia bacterium]|nr:amidohydrolase family protein [Polyangia bacterium]
MSEIAVRRALACCALGLFACAPAAPSVRAAAKEGAPVTAFVGVAVVPLDRERVLEAQTVLVRGDRIVAVGPRASVAVPAGARVIDGRGRWLMPGLVDAHAHLVREADLQLYLARGVTAVRNMFGAPIHLAWRARIAAGELLGPTIYTAGPIVDGESPAHDGSLVVRTPEEVDGVIALHRRAGYDFIKIYSGLSRPVYERLVIAARAADLPIAGHVPRAVGLERALDGMRSIEHLTGFVDALQADDSPVAGKLDRASRQRQIDFVDERKLAPLIAKLRERGVWNCPTRVVKNQWGAAADVRARLARPEMRFVPACTRATWEPEERSPAAEERAARALALDDRLLRALHDGGARVVAGTDPVNPLVVPGYSLHEELAAMVRAGFTPFEALRAATRDAAELMRVADAGTIAVGQRADLLLVDGDPLADVANAARLSGVMARGRWLDGGEIPALLERVAAAMAPKDYFAGAPPLVDGGSRRDFAATYEISWKGVRFGGERLAVARAASGALTIDAQTFDPHIGRLTTARLEAGAAGDGERLVIASDGADGRGRVELVRDGTRARGRGTLLAGVEVAVDEPLPDGALLAPDGFVAGRILLAPRLAALAVGQTLDVRVRDVALGSAVELRAHALHVARTGDVTLGAAAARRYELKPDAGPPSVLYLDAAGWPLELEIEAYGATVRFKRVE